VHAGRWHARLPTTLGARAAREDPSGPRTPAEFAPRGVAACPFVRFAAATPAAVLGRLR